jgi:peptide/nickel transport system substrate-binding protein/oligopeptide transport system substrate-binding protein
LRSLVVYLVCAASIVGCSKSLPESKTLYLALETSPNRLDPPLVVDVAEGQICSLLYQGLVRFSPQGEVIPDAARSWEIENGGTRYVFRLDSRTRFSDGVTLGARDVVSSFERVLAPESRSPRKWVLDRIRGAESFSAGSASSLDGLSAPDDSTVVIELEKPFRPFLELLAMPAAYIVKNEESSAGRAARQSQDLAAAPAGSAAGQPVGSGRWVLSRWERGDFL